MSRLLLFLLLLFAFNGSRAADKRHDTLVHFASDEHALTAEAMARLDAFVAGIDRQAEVEITIAGHTDSDASQGYNEQLALRRSHAVRDYLIARGVAADAIALSAFGEREAIASNSDEEGQAANRRVQVSCTTHTWETTADLQARLREGSEQTFSIDPNIEQTITTAAGAKLQLQALALVDADGRPVTSEVQLHVTDALDLDAILGHSLSTRSGDQLIETAGMLKIEAVGSDGLPLNLDPSKPLNITLPAATQKDGMQLFLSDDGSDWATPPVSTVFSWTIAYDEFTGTAPPNVQWPAMKKLTYHEPKGAPRKPVEPAMPREPLEPRRENFSTAWTWWKFVSRATLRAEDEQRYAAAMAKHAERMEKHERRVQEYDEECAAYPQALVDHSMRMAEWQEHVAQDREQWQRDVYQPAWDEYQRRREAVRPRNDSIMAAWRMRNDSLAELRRTKRDEYNAAYAARMDSIGNVATTGSLQGYVLTSAKLGWINCDRFLDDPSPRVILAVADPDASDEEVYLVFTGIKSMLQMPRNDVKEYSLSAIPKNQPAVLFAYKVQDGKPMLCHQPVDHAKKMKLDFRPSSFAEIRLVLRALNGSDA